MTVTSHERPGVYSAYSASSITSGRSEGGVCGLAGCSSAGEKGTAYLITSYAQAVERFGRDQGSAAMCGLISLMLQNGASAVVAVPAAVGSAASAEDYAAAFEVLSADTKIKVVACDSGEREIHALMRASVESASEARRERVGVVSCADSDVDMLVARAAGLNSHRMILAGPAAMNQDGSETDEPLKNAAVAAATAGVIASASDPATPFHGAVLEGIKGLSAAYSDNDIDMLVRGGVTPVEWSAGAAEIVRGITTCTKSGSVPDATWRELTTILVADDVISTLRGALHAKFKRAKNTPSVREAIGSQLVVELESKVNAGIINGYEPPKVKQSEADPGICEAEVCFNVACGLNQIHIAANITV